MRWRNLLLDCNIFYFGRIKLSWCSRVGLCQLFCFLWYLCTMFCNKKNYLVTPWGFQGWVGGMKCYLPPYSALHSAPYSGPYSKIYYLSDQLLTTQLIVYKTPYTPPSFQKIFALSIAEAFRNFHFLLHFYQFSQWMRCAIFQINTNLLII